MGDSLTVYRELPAADRPRTEGALFSVFIDPDGTHSGPNGLCADVVLDDEDRADVDAHVASWLMGNAEHVARQRRWFEERAWDAIHVGMRCEEAIALLEERGWR